MKKNSELKEWVYPCERSKKDLKWGNLYFLEYDEENIIPQAKDTDRFADKKSGNLHLYPSNIKLEEFFSTFIKKKLEEIKKYIEEYTMSEEYKEYINQKCIIREPRKDGKYAGMHLFNYLKVHGKKTNFDYDLTGIRFFIDEINQVNCILLRFQIKMYPKSDEPKSIEWYPDMSLDLPDSLDREKMGNKVYSNLDVDIHSDAKMIAEAFLNFVADQEKKKAPKKEEQESIKQ